MFEFELVARRREDDVTDILLPLNTAMASISLRCGCAITMLLFGCGKLQIK